MTVIRIPRDEELLKLLGDLEASELRTSDNWEDDLADLVANGKRITGDPLPWGKTEAQFRFRPGEVTIWAGFNGSKKSMLSGQVMAWLARKHKICIASLEMRPVDTLYRMAKQTAGCHPSAQYARSFCQWAGNRIYIYDQLDTVPPDRILGAMYYAAKELGCKHILIDSLAKCGTGDAHDVEKLFIDRLAWAAKTLGVHIHLVAHVRKPQSAGEEYIPNKFDIRGHGSLVDLVDNCLIVWADKRRAKALNAMEEGRTLDPKEQEYVDKSSDQKLIVCKQRHGDWEGTINLYFNKDSLQFVGDRQGKNLPFPIPMIGNADAG